MWLSATGVDSWEGILYKRSMMSHLVTYQTEGGVALLSFTNPPANAYSYEMMRALDHCLLEARMDESVHVIVLTGNGDRFFCAGADISMLNEVSPNFKYYFCLHANETLNRLEQTPKLVIAALNGHCVGGGLEIAMAADMRVAKEDGGKLGLPEVALGVLPGTGGTQRLCRLVGKAKAMEMMVTGASMTFEEARSSGLVNALLSADNFMADVMSYARQFTPPHRASLAVGAIKRAVISGHEMSFSDGLALERELQQRLFCSDDAREGLAAYADKRPPEFTGS